jgi:HlyD family secretion protein
MKPRAIWLPAIGVVVVVAGFWAYRRAKGGEAPAYRFATVGRGNLESAVTATGTLSALRTVQVGTQVSGQVAAIYVDFNDRVRKGQLIARIDPTLLDQAVRDAEAGVERSEAESLKAERDYVRTRQLRDSGGVTESELNDAEYAWAVARAGAKSSAVALERARLNLAYTSIYAPIDGIVVERNVDVGQTVAASLQAPQLFLIANDLSRMQVLALVDESDIGSIRPGQSTHFTVEAYPQEVFTGSVQQVRLQSTVQENVVNYTVVVQVANPKGKLLPGMTATVSFVTGSASDALLVPNAALRYKPAGVSGDSMPALWYVGTDGQLTRLRVRAGLSDGQRTQVEGTGLRAGLQVVVGTTQGAISSTGVGTTASPFRTQRQPAAGPPPRTF